jgi:hypothetical protein
MPFLSGKLVEQEDLHRITAECKQRFGHITKSHHVWINDIEDSTFRKSLDSVRSHTNIFDSIRAKFPNTMVYSVPEADEIYWAVSPKQAGGSDRVLVDCHYDAPFSIIPTGGVTYYRVIVATNENNTVTTVFPAEHAQTKMTTGDYHGLDYNRDWHCVEGQIEPEKFRILLKLHYLIVPEGMDKRGSCAQFTQWLNVSWNKFSRETMRMSAEPTNFFEWLVAILVNICRILFNNVYIVVFLILLAWIGMGHQSLSPKKGIKLLRS